MHTSPLSSPILLRNDANQDGRDDFKRLSDEIILHIFAYLPKPALTNCGMTCRRFRTLSLDDSLWKRLDLGGKSISGELLHRLLGRGVHYARLAKAEIWGQYWPRPPPQVPSRVRYLDLSMLTCGNPVIIYEILSRCTELVAVSMENCIIDDRSCAELSKNKQLKMLNLSSAQGLTAGGLQMILNGCRHLEELNVGWTQLTRDGVNVVCTNAPQSLLRLNLAGCRGDVLFDGDIITLCSCCPNLVELDVSDAGELTRLSIEAINELVPNLRVLSCSRCYKIDPSAYGNLPPTIMELNIFNSIHELSWPAFQRLLPKTVNLNTSVFSTIARPTVGIRRTSIWGNRVRDE